MKTSPDVKPNNHTVNVLLTQKETSVVLLCKRAQLCQNRAFLLDFRLIHATVTIRTFP